MEAKKEEHGLSLQLSTLKVSAEALVKENPDDIPIYSSTKRGYFSFLIQPQIDAADVLNAAVRDGRTEWIKKILLANVIDINNPRDCGGQTVLSNVLLNFPQEEIVSFLCTRSAKLTAKEVIECSSCFYSSVV